jgi:small subunit ribosomal protein S6
MRPYEIAVILNVTLDETETKEFTDRIGELIKSKDGTIGHINRWGRRQFAYEINHQTEGVYIFIEFTAEPPLVAEVDRLLRLSDAVIRHRIIKQPETKVSDKKTVSKAALETHAG